MRIGWNARLIACLVAMGTQLGSAASGRELGPV